MPVLIPTAPPMRVEAYLGGSAFTLDHPTQGLLNAGNVLGPIGDGWHDLHDPCTRVSWRIGADNPQGPTSRLTGGFASVTIYDPARTYDPGYGPSPFHGRFKPNTPFRIVCTIDGTDVPQFTGRIFEAGWADGYAGLEVADGIADLAAYDANAIAAVGAGETTGARLRRILTLIGYRGPLGTIAAGTQTVQATQMAQPALTEAWLTSDSEVGLMWVDRAGRFQFRDRTAWTVRRPATWELGAWALRGILTSTRSRMTADNARTIIFGAGEGLSQQEVFDLDAVAEWGYRRWGRNDLLLRDDAALVAWANTLLPWFADPRPGAIEQMVLWPPGAPDLWPVLLGPGAMLGESVHLAFDRQTDETPILLGWAHNVTATDWQTTLVLAPHPLDAVAGGPFTLNDPGTLDMLDAGNVIT